MATCSKPNHVRSISLPGRSHPTTQRVEEALTNLKSLEISTESTPENMSNGLLGLEELYKCMNDLLNLPQTLRGLSGNQQGKWAEDLLDKSVRLLDLCDTTRELVLQCKKNVRDLQSSLRRRKTDSTIEASSNKFTSFNKKIKKEAKRLDSALKKMHQEIDESVFQEAELDTVAMIRALKEANSMCIYVFQMLLTCLSVPLLKPKSSKWSLVSRLVNKERLTCEGQEEKMNLENRLESIEAHFDTFENGLEGLFRCLIRSRSSLLNIFSC